MPESIPDLLIVTGMSGAGKSTVLDTLEDWGWEIVDNLPLDLIAGFTVLPRADGAPRAIGIDIRSRGFAPDALIDALDAMKDGIDRQILFLDCSTAELVRRFDETRRRHPLASDRPAEDGIWLERRTLQPLREAAQANGECLALREALGQTPGSAPGSTPGSTPGPTTDQTLDQTLDQGSGN